ncbi:MAG: cytochrome C oxidase subunit IV family protein [Phycisphaerales bacterium]|nr:cytochrome C oxidase subunit IV family protein [Phycisphaerales bacterium]
MSLFTLRAVLAVLLIFTVMTVAAAQFELWAQSYFDIVLPKWVNIAVALSIATVKSALVLLYFMQLRYDNPINTIVFLFTLFAFALFLGFTTLDLANRGTIYKYKSEEAIKGGLGLTRHTGERDEVTGERQTEMVVGSIVAHARKKYLDELATRLGDMELAKEEFARQEAEAHSHGHHGPRVVTTSDHNHSRPRTGLTTDLYDAAPASHDAHGGHGGGAAR